MYGLAQWPLLVVHIEIYYVKSLMNNDDQDPFQEAIVISWFWNTNTIMLVDDLGLICAYLNQAPPAHCLQIHIVTGVGQFPNIIHID